MNKSDTLCTLSPEKNSPRSIFKKKNEMFDPFKSTGNFVFGQTGLVLFSDRRTFGLVACPLYYRYIYLSFLIITAMGPTHSSILSPSSTLYFRSQSGTHVEIMHLNDIYHVYVIFTCTNCVCLCQLLSQTNFYNVNDPHTSQWRANKIMNHVWKRS